MKAKISIYAICFNMLIYLVLSVSIAGAVAAFPNSSVTAVQYLLTIPSLACIAGTLMVPYLSTKVSLKKLSLTSQIVSVAGAAAYVFLPGNLGLLYFASVVLGVTYGILATVYPLLINVHIPENEVGKVNGFGSGMVQFGRLASLFIAGFLAEIRWNYVYLSYILVAIAAVIVAVMLPEDQPRTMKNSSSGSVYKGFFRREIVWFVAVWDFLFGIIYFMTNTHVSLYIENNALGTASTTGIITSVACGAAGVIACMFALIYRRTKKFTLFFIFLVIGIGYIVAGSFVSMPTIIFGVLCASAATAMFTPYILTVSSARATPETVAMTISIAITCLSVGFFVSPMISNAVAGTMGGGQPASVYLFGGILALICCVFIYFTDVKRSRG